MRSALFVLACSAAIAMPGASARAQAAPTAMLTVSDPYADSIAEAAQRFGIPAAWIRTIMRVESGGDRQAVSPAGAMGLMQIMPETWSELRARYGLGRDPYNARDNILAGAAFLREMHDRYGSPGFLAAYNAGPARYEDYRDRHRPLPSETLAYVAELLPLLGNDEGAIPVLKTVSDSLAWTHAPIFIKRDPPSIAPQSAGLFVVLSTAEPKP